jgi:hypothetical protein
MIGVKTSEIAELKREVVFATLLEPQGGMFNVGRGGGMKASEAGGLNARSKMKGLQRRCVGATAG